MTSRHAVHINLPKLVTGAIDENLAKAGTPIIGTHDGRFHCDDALAVGLLLSMPEYKEAVVVRTRKQELLDQATVVVDVGGVYDPSKLRFDHHHRGFNDFFDANWRTVTKMSSAGGVFKHFGSKILKEFNVPSNYTDVVIKKLYESLVESVDALDNGVNICPNGVEPLYMIRSDLTSRVARLNEEWNEWTDDSVAALDFTKAVEMAMEEFVCHVRLIRDSWIPARVIVEKGLAARFNTHSSGRIVELDTGCPFEDHLEELETQIGKTDAAQQHKPILFVIYPNTEDKSSWRVKAVKASRNAFGNRLDLPERLAGLRDADIAKEFPGVNFVHHARFLAGCESREACLRLVDTTLKEAKIDVQKQ